MFAGRTAVPLRPQAPHPCCPIRCRCDHQAGRHPATACLARAPPGARSDTRAGWPESVERAWQGEGVPMQSSGALLRSPRLLGKVRF